MKFTSETELRQPDPIWFNRLERRPGEFFQQRHDGDHPRNPRNSRCLGDGGLDDFLWSLISKKAHRFPMFPIWMRHFYTFLYFLKLIQSIAFFGSLKVYIIYIFYRFFLSCCGSWPDYADPLRPTGFHGISWDFMGFHERCRVNSACSFPCRWLSYWCET